MAIVMEEKSLRILAGDPDTIDADLRHIPLDEQGPMMGTMIIEHGKRVAHDPECGLVGLALLAESVFTGSYDIRRGAIASLHYAHPELARFIARVMLLNPDKTAREDCIHSLDELGELEILIQAQGNDPDQDIRELAEDLMKDHSSIADRSSKGTYTSPTLSDIAQETLVATFAAALYESRYDIRLQSLSSVSVNHELETILLATLTSDGDPLMAYHAFNCLKNVEPAVARYVAFGLRAHPNQEISVLATELLQDLK
jgi:hypothetical protein